MTWKTAGGFKCGGVRAWVSLSKSRSGNMWKLGSKGAGKELGDLSGQSVAAWTVTSEERTFSV